MDEVELPHIPELLKCNYTYSFDYGLYLTLAYMYMYVHVAKILSNHLAIFVAMTMNNWIHCFNLLIY